MPSYKADLYLILIAVVWGSGFFFTKITFKTMGPLTYIGWRFLIGWLTLFIIHRKNAIPGSTSQWHYGLILGGSLGLGYCFQNLGLQYTSSGKAGFLTSLYIIAVPFLEALLLGRKLKFQVVISVLVATIGLALLSLDSGLNLNLADGWLLLCAAAFSIQILAVSLYGERSSPSQLASAQLLCAAIITMVIATIFENPLKGFTPVAIASLIFTGSIGTALGFTIQMKAQPHTTATRAALLMALESPFAVLFGWWFANEHLTAKEWVGCLLISIAILIVEWKKAGNTKPKVQAISDDPAA